MKKSLYQSLFIVFLLFCSTLSLLAGEYTVQSPGEKNTLFVNVAENITWGVKHGPVVIIEPSPISMKVDGQELGKDPQVTDESRQSIDTEIVPVVREKRSVIRDNYNELVLEFEGKYSLVFRVYDDAAAYRWKTGFSHKITVQGETASFRFTEDFPLYFQEEDSFFTHSERESLHLQLSEVTAERMACCPALVELANGLKVAVTEADLEDYAGMYLAGSSVNKNCLSGKFPYFVTAEKQKGDRNVEPVERANYLARTKGDRFFPWRVLIITENDREILNNQTVFKLAPRQRLEDTSWIKPGKVAWEWWNYNNIYGVDFEAGVNTATYKYYIDFAARYGLEYVALDEGWYELGDLMSVSPEIDLEEIIKYAKSKNVYVILWVVWKTLEDQWDAAFEEFSRLGISGIKVDFMQRDDQWMVNYYWRVAEECAKRKLLVDFHGAYKPTGLRRAWPNVISREGVRGLENTKWSDVVNPESDLTIPFIRMLTGPMDFTPGAMVNMNRENFKPIFNQPMSMGTRCHQLAMFVIYESPLQMLADNPSNYYKEPECMEFIEAVPTTWDETAVLHAAVSDYAVMARKHGDTWFIGAMTDDTARNFSINFA
ncbi:MAG: glycoside hydrolase family 97 protein, partial [Acidobacteriota bacterium]